VADWHRACGSDELKTLPRSVRIEGREVVVWRLPDGGVAALDDRCTHQWVRLSLGNVLPDGCLMCPSHGWTFRPNGENFHLSWTEAVPAHEAKEEGGDVLVRLGPPRQRLL
jgi:phenylpropionate dioxygenase-like ring-hydroxylating dioxygenase large terminal subunit